MPNNGEILSRVKYFFSSLWQSLQNGLLFIGGPLDIVVAVVDILFATIFFYFILRLIRDSRAWQLLKGIILIIFMGLAANLVGLNTISYLLNNTIQVFAIAFVVIFQPELRRALETVGRTSLVTIQQNINNEGNKGATSNLIEELVKACSYMAKTRTGALIILERTTPLGDLMSQENAQLVDSPVSDTMLRQIFYVGTPLHDGAVLIRDGKIEAARIHIPLADSSHIRSDFGTRHRAAIGASEMGDTVAIAISEEKGTISLALEGRLFVLDGPDSLRKQLYRLLMPGKQKHRKFAIFRKREGAGETLFAQPKRRSKLGLAALSLSISLVLWTYVQVQVNPLVSRNFQLDLHFRSESVLAQKGLEMTYPIQTINLRVTGRKNYVEDLTTRDLEAYVDMSKMDKPGIYKLPVEIDKTSSFYSKMDNIEPETVSVVVRPYEQE